MEWFFRWTNRLYGHQSLGESVQYVNRNAVYNALHKQYNVDKQTYNIEKTLTFQWDSWLTHDVMLRQDVERTEKKHLWIMYLIKKVGQTKTNGYETEVAKISRYHAHD